MQEEIIQKLGELLKQEDIQQIAAEVKSLESEFYKLQKGNHAESVVEEPTDDQSDEFDEEEEEENSEETEVVAESAEEVKSKPEKSELEKQFDALMAQFTERFTKHREAQKAEAEQNFNIKAEIIAKLRKLVAEEENIGKAFHTLNELKAEWKATGHVSPQKYKPLQNEYSKLLEEFYYTINIYKELKEHDLKKNLDLKKEVVQQIAALKAEPSIKKVQTLIGAYLSSWDEIGPTQPDAWPALRDEYRKETEVVFGRIKEHYKTVKEQQKVNLDAKQALLDELKTVDYSELSNAKGWKKTTDKVIKIQQDWRAVGFTSKKVHGKLWDEFRSLCDAFFTSKKEFHATLKGQFDDHAIRKKELIDKAIALQSSSDLNAATQEYKKLQQSWKKIGLCAPRDEQKLWNKFHEACNTFFESKKEHSAKADKERSAALSRKKALLTALENVEVPRTADGAKEVLSDLNKQWKEAGEAPYQEDKKLNGIFRKSIEEICEKSGIAPDESEELMFSMKLELISSTGDAENSYYQEKQAIRDKMNKLEATILQYENNLTFFSKAKGAAELTKEVLEKVETARQEVLALRKKLAMITKAMKVSEKVETAQE